MGVRGESPPPGEAARMKVTERELGGPGLLVWCLPGTQAPLQWGMLRGRQEGLVFSPGSLLPPV